MTFAEVVNRVASRLNLSSAEALTRISEGVNDRYRQVLAGVGLQTSVRATVTQAATSGNRLLTFASVEKLYVVFDANVTPVRVLEEISVDEMRNRPLGTQPSREYALWRSGATSVTIQLDATPTSAYVYSADAEAIVADLTGMDEPAFPESYHDLLVFGGMSEELFKMEKYDKAQLYESRYQSRLSELRLHLASSAYRDMWMGKQDRTRWVW